MRKQRVLERLAVWGAKCEALVMTAEVRTDAMYLGAHLFCPGDHVVCDFPQCLGLWQRGLYPFMLQQLRDHGPVRHTPLS